MDSTCVSSTNTPPRDLHTLTSTACGVLLDFVAVLDESGLAVPALASPHPSSSVDKRRHTSSSGPRREFTRCRTTCVHSQHAIVCSAGVFVKSSVSSPHRRRPRRADVP